MPPPGRVGFADFAALPPAGFRALDFAPAAAFDPALRAARRTAFVRMLHESLENGRLSARKAAKTMGLGLGGLAELFAQYDLPAPFEL